MNERPDKPRPKVKPRLGTAGIALMAGLAAGSAAAKEEPKPFLISGPTPVENPDKPRTLQDFQWFTEKVASNKATTEELSRLESMVLEDKIPLEIQVRFLERLFQHNGAYDRELHEKKLTAERYSRLLELNSKVSARMTLAYATGRYSAGMAKYFDIQKVRDATHPYAPVMPADAGHPEEWTRFCNLSFTQSEGDVYADTAAHCVVGSKEAKEYTIDISNDVAVRYIPKNEWEKWGITDPDALPQFNTSITEESASGHVVASFSWSPVLTPKAYFSIVMPFPKHARMLAFGDDVDTTFPTLKHAMVFLKPAGEARAVEWDDKGNVTRRGAQGSSGSNVTIDTKNGYLKLGGFTAIKKLDDSCRQICYEIAFASGPNVVRNAIYANREARLEEMLQDNDPPPLAWKPTVRHAEDN